jgi:hypothetical protein
MIGNKTPAVVALMFVIFSYSLVQDANAQAMKSITVPADTNVVLVDSSYCEPIYNENTGSLYVPRCWKLKQERKVGYLERTIGRTVENTGTEVENSINNGIDNAIRKIGEEIDRATGVR